MKQRVVGALLLFLLASPVWGQEGPLREAGPPQGQQKPESVLLALALLSNALQDLLAKHENEREVLRKTVVQMAEKEVWWHSCVKNKICVEWATSAPTGLPDSPYLGAPLK